MPGFHRRCNNYFSLSNNFNWFLSSLYIVSISISRFFIIVIVIVYADSSRPTLVEQKGTNSHKISPVSTAAGMLTSHESHQV